MLSLKASCQRMQYSMIVFIYTKFKNLQGQKMYKVYHTLFKGKYVCCGRIRTCMGVINTKSSAYSGKGEGAWDCKALQ